MSDDMRVEESIEIDRPVEEAFAYVANPENLLEWSGLAIEVKDAPGKEGDTFTVVAKFLAAGSRRPTRGTLTSPTGATRTELRAVRSLIRIGPTPSKR